MGSPCGWTVERCGGCGTCWQTLPPATRERAAMLASAFMWAATGRRYGLCEITVLPANQRQVDPLYQTYELPPVGGGYDVWGGPGYGQYLPNGGCGCGCGSVCEVDLPAPVATIVLVTVDGVAVPPSAYQVHDQHLLVRVDGACWPTCRRRLADFAVTYLRGDPIPPSVQDASEALACEYAKACTGAVCQLPDRLTSLSRQGVEVTLAEVDRDGGTLLTNITRIDDVIKAVNPSGRTERWPAPVSPDMPPPRMVTSSGVSITPGPVEGSTS